MYLTKTIKKTYKKTMKYQKKTNKPYKNQKTRFFLIKTIKKPVFLATLSLNKVKATIKYKKLKRNKTSKN